MAGFYTVRLVMSKSASRRLVPQNNGLGRADHPEATAIFRRLTEGLTKLGDHRKLDDAPGFMPVSVELVGRLPQGAIFAVAHDYEQCGDLVADPDILTSSPRTACIPRRSSTTAWPSTTRPSRLRAASYV